MPLNQVSLQVATTARVLACPVCRGPLAGTTSALRCRPCRLRYGSAGDVYLIRPPFSSNGVVHEPWDARMCELLTEAQGLGWEDALGRFRREVLSGRLSAPAASLWARARAKMRGSTWEDVLRDLIDPTSAGWKFLLDLRPHSRVLFLGPSWGAAPLSLAKNCAHVAVLDGSVERLQLVAHQAAAAGVGNLTLACVRDPLRLPLPAASVDVAVVPSLAEWLTATGHGVRGRRARALSRLLVELRLLLVPGGHAYVGTVNRFPWRLLEPEVGGAAASPAEVQDVARAAGFRACRLLAPVPFRHKFHQVLDVERRDRMSFSPDAYRTRGRVLRLLVRGWDACQRTGIVERQLYRHLPTVSAVLSTGPGRESFGERLLDHLAAGGRIPRGVRLQRYYVRPKGVVVLMNGAPGDAGAIVRLPLDERAAEACRRHHAALTMLARDPRLPASLRALFPMPLAEGTFEGQGYFAESALSGESGRRYYARSRRRYDRAVAEAVDVLAALRRATEEPVRIDEREFDRLCGRWLGDFTALVEDEGLRRTLEAIAELLRHTLLGVTLPLGWQHGDLDFANLLYGREDQVTAVLDFEVFEARGLPLLDLLLLLARRPIRRQRLTFGTIFTRSIFPRDLPRLEAGLLAREMTALGADDQLYRALALCCWLNHLRLRRDSWLVRSPSWRDANLHAVAEHVRRAL